MVETPPGTPSVHRQHRTSATGPRHDGVYVQCVSSFLLVVGGMMSTLLVSTPFCSVSRFRCLEDPQDEPIRRTEVWGV